MLASRSEVKPSSGVALHGAVYGQNFGDVLIQALFYTRLAELVPLRLSIPFASSGFSHDFVVTVEHVYARALAAEADITWGCWGPGGYFGERPFHQAEWHSRLQTFHGQFLKFLRQYDLPSIIYGLGIGPLSDERSRDFVRQCLSSAAHSFVRDAQSYQEAVNLGIDPQRVSVTPDAIFLLKREDVPAAVIERSMRMLAISNGRRKIGLHLPDISAGSGTEIKAVVDCIASIAANYDASDFFLIADSPYQEEILAGLRARLAGSLNVHAVKYSGVMDLVGVLSCLDTVVTTKLHVGLCAFALGHLPVAIHQHPKVLVQYREAGIPEQCCSVNDVNIDWFSRAFEKAVNFRQGSLDLGIAVRRDAATCDIRRIANIVMADFR